MDRQNLSPWLRTLLGAMLLASLALCSAADPEEEARLGRLQEMLEAESWDEVIAEAGGILADSPDNATARAKLGLALLGKARSEESVLDESRFQQTQGATDPSAFFDPNLFRTEVNYDDTLRAQAREEFERVLSGSPGNLDALVGMATFHYEAGEFDEEKEAISRAAKAHKGNEEAGRRLLRFGELFFAEARYADALEVFQLLHESFPEDPTVALDYGAAQFANGRYDTGIETVALASAKDPENERVLQTLGQMYLFRLRWAEGAKVFEAAGKLSPDDSMITVHRGAALMPVDPDGARAAFQAVVDGDPDKTTPASVVAANLLVALDESKVTTPHLVYLSNELSRQRMPQIAATLGGVLLVRDPKSIGGRLVLAAVYDGLQYFDLSRQTLQEAERIFQEDPGASAPYTRIDLTGSAGRSYFTQGDYQKVIELFESSSDPERFRLALALSHEQLGNYDRAFAYFTQIVEAGEPAAQALQASEHLEKPEYSEFVNQP